MSLKSSDGHHPNTCAMELSLTRGPRSPDGASLRRPAAAVALLVLALGVGFLTAASLSASHTFLVRSGTSIHAHPATSDGNSLLAEPRPKIGAKRATPRRAAADNPVCPFLRQGQGNVRDEVRWGKHTLCHDEETVKWLSYIEANCHSCSDGRNFCSDPPQLLFHMSLEFLHKSSWQGNLLAIQAFLMTQDLRHSRMILWVPHKSAVYDSRTAAFFDAFADYVSIRVLDWDAEIKGTPFEADPFFGDHKTMSGAFTSLACYADVLRHLVLHNYGGMWLDNDMVLFRNLRSLLSSGYQWVVRWTNNHVIYMKARSPLARRLLQICTTMPLNMPNFTNEVVEARCKPNGYFTIVSEKDRYQDVYNGCVYRLAIRFNNTGPADAVLYDQPLGWWDPEWPGCLSNRNPVNDSAWFKYATEYMGIHTRYPKDNNAPPRSPLQRTISLVEGFFKSCSSVHCLPLEGRNLVSYELHTFQAAELANELDVTNLRS